METPSAPAHLAPAHLEGQHEDLADPQAERVEYYRAALHTLIDIGTGAGAQAGCAGGGRRQAQRRNGATRRGGDGDPEEDGDEAGERCADEDDPPETADKLRKMSDATIIALIQRDLERARRPGLPVRPRGAPVPPTATPCPAAGPEPPLRDAAGSDPPPRRGMTAGALPQGPPWRRDL
jgi:hypothetical protein